MRVTPVQTSFTSGELSPRVMARVDLDAYYSGAAFLENFIALPHGPVLRRAGTTFIHEAKSSTVRLITFKFSVTQSFVIELGPNYARFYFKGGIIEKNGAPLEVSTPYTAAMLPGINYAQSGDIIYLVHPDVVPQKLSRLANDNWTIAAVSFTNQPASWKSANWPSVLVFHEQRLFYAATPLQPQTIWASRVGLFDEFTSKNSEGEVLDDMAIEYTIASDDVNGIMWLKAIDILAAGTSGAEYRISSSSLNEAITPKNLRISRQTSYGSAAVRPIQIGPGIAFVQRSRNRVRSFEFLFTDNQYTATDLTVLSEHIAKDGIIEMDLQTAKDTYLWCVTGAGHLLALTYEKQQKVIAWHRHILANNGKVKSLAIIPGEPADEVWLMVERVINGTKRYYIEAFLDAFSETNDAVDCKFVDSCLSYIGSSPIIQVGGLNHLEGQEVSILVDGWVHPNEVVNRGSVVLQSPGKVIHIGLPYVSELHSSPVQSQDMVTSGKPKRLVSADISFLKSLGFEYGVLGQRLDEAFMGPTRIMNQAQNLFTGVRKVCIPASSEAEQQLVVRQALPLPCIVRAIKYTMDVN